MKGLPRIVVMTIAAWTALFAPIVRAEVQAVTQVLEEVVGFADGEAIRVNREDLTQPPFSQLDIVGSDFRACELTAAGIICLSGNDIMIWDQPVPLGSGDVASDPGSPVFSCSDKNLPFDTKGIACTSATANPAGDEIVVGGKGKGKLFDLTLVKACAEADSSFSPLASDPSLCFKSLNKDRPLIVTLEYLKDDSSLAPGILSLEERTRATLVDFNGTATPLGDSKTFGLSGNERLTGLTALHLDEETFPVIAANDFLLATTTRDGIIAQSTGSATPTSFRAFDIAAARDPSKAQCSFGGPQSPISTGFKSGFVYVTDGQYCNLFVLKPVVDPLGAKPFVLDVVAVIDTQTATEQFALEGVTTAPGITINLADCQTFGTCTFIPDGENGNGKPDVEVVNLHLNTGSGIYATVYQIKNAPDCRYIPQACVELEQFAADYDAFLKTQGLPDSTDSQVQFLVNAGVILPEPGSAPGNNPGAWEFNVADILPQEITDAVDIPDELVISRGWRAQLNNGFYWEAMFVAAEGVVTTGSFELIFDTPDLVTSGNAETFGCPSAPSTLTKALEEDLVTTVSENFLSGSAPDEYRDTPTNFGCGSSKTLGERFSLRPYNLEWTPCSVAYADDLLWKSDGVCTIGGIGEVVDDAVLMKRTIELWFDLGDVLENFACAAGDGQSVGQPFLESDCNSSLIPTYNNGTDKLSKCWEALQQPKQSALDQNCQAWLSQSSNLRSNILTATQNAGPLDPDGNPDFANRKAEVLNRLDIIINLFNTRVVKTITGGFVEPQ